MFYIFCENGTISRIPNSFETRVTQNSIEVWDDVNECPRRWGTIEDKNRDFHVTQAEINRIRNIMTAESVMHHLETQVRITAARKAISDACVTPPEVETPPIFVGRDEAAPGSRDKSMESVCSYQDGIVHVHDIREISRIKPGSDETVVPPAQKPGTWRLLNHGEKIMEGDEFFNVNTSTKSRWEAYILKIREEQFDATYHLPHRRRM